MIGYLDVQGVHERKEKENKRGGENGGYKVVMEKQKEM